jgi:hypothetical protein
VTIDEGKTEIGGPAGGAGRGAFLAFRFAVELATIAVLAAAGASASASLPVRIVLAIVGPVVLMVIWGLFMAPNARRRLREPRRLIAELVIFVASAAALAVAGETVPAVIYAIIAVAAALVSRVIAPEA